MKRKITTMLLVLIASLIIPIGAAAEEAGSDFQWGEYQDEYYTEPYDPGDYYYPENGYYGEDSGENGEEEEEEIDPVNVDTSKKVKPGGDKIHIIKVFEQKSPCDALLIESDGHYAMIDVGAPYDYQYNTARDTENSVVNYLKNYGVEKLDFIIFTHLHTDHIGNIDYVLRSFPVDTVYCREPDKMLKRKALPSQTRFSKLFKQYKVKSEALEEGQVIELGNLSLKMFNLDDDIKSIDETCGENGNCVATLITDAYGHKAFLAADMNNYDGDEDRLVQNHWDELSNVDFFKVGHHGFEGSSTYDFVNMLNPLYVAVSGYTITGREDPFGDGNSVWDNYKETRAYAQETIYYSNFTPNGIIFNMGEECSINSNYKKPSRSGDATNTLSVYYNANGGRISDYLTNKYHIADNGIICQNEDSATENDYVQQRMLAGDVAPMYLYDMKRALETAEHFGLVRTGHTFDGWYIAGDREHELSVNKKYEVLDIAPELKDDSSNLMLVAVWKANDYNILYHANGGHGSMKSMECVYNKKDTLTLNRFERDQYAFMGWNTEQDGSGDIYQDGAEIKNLAVKDGKTIVLYAQWEKIGVGAPRAVKNSENK